MVGILFGICMALGFIGGILYSILKVLKSIDKKIKSRNGFKKEGYNDNK